MSQTEDSKIHTTYTAIFVLLLLAIIVFALIYAPIKGILLISIFIMFVIALFLTGTQMLRYEKKL